MKTQTEHKPVLYFGIEEEDAKAYQAVVRSGIRCQFVGTMDPTVPTPVLDYRYHGYQGIKEIRRFIKRMKT